MTAYNAPDNLIALCQACHGAAHKELRKPPNSGAQMKLPLKPPAAEQLLLFGGEQAAVVGGRVRCY